MELQQQLGSNNKPGYSFEMWIRLSSIYLSGWNTAVGAKASTVLSSHFVPVETLVSLLLNTDIIL